MLRNEKESMMKPVDTESLKSADTRRITKFVPRPEIKAHHEMVEENYHKYFIEKTHEKEQVLVENQDPSLDKEELNKQAAVSKRKTV